MAEIIGIDFTKRKKDSIRFTLPVEAGSDEGFEISVLTPTKRGYDALGSLAGQLDEWANGDLEAEEFDMGAVVSLVAQAMSHNLQRREITPEYLDSIGFDLADVSDFLGAYMYFLMQLADEKNFESPGPSPETTQG